MSGRANACSLLAVLVLTGCGGSADRRPLVDTGHGSVEEVLAVMAERGVPCADSVAVQTPPGTEQAVRCTVEGEEVLLLHFLSEEAARLFAEELEREGEPGVHTATWGLRAESAKTADAVRTALQR